MRKGNDRNSGSKDSPLKTVEEALRRWNADVNADEHSHFVTVMCDPKSCKMHKCRSKGCRRKVCEEHADGHGTRVAIGMRKYATSFYAEGEGGVCGDDGCTMAYCNEHTHEFGGGMCELCDGVEARALGSEQAPLPAPPLCKTHTKVCRRQFDHPTFEDTVQCTFRCCPRHIKNHNCQYWNDMNFVRRKWPHGNEDRRGSGLMGRPPLESMGTLEIDGAELSTRKYDKRVNGIPWDDPNLQGNINDDGEFMVEGSWTTHLYR